MSGKVVKKTSNGVASALQYTPAQVRESKGCIYLEFYAFDPEQGKMRRKRIKTNHGLNGLTNRRKYAKEVAARVNDQLRHGWNPWIAQDVENLSLFSDAAERYENHIEKMYDAGYFRKETYAGYKSYLKMMRKFISEKHPIYYCFQFNKHFCNDFLDWVFVERDNTAQTRNNYLNFLRVFSGFLVEKDYLKTRPTDGINPISKRLFEKERTCIPADVVGKIAGWCMEKDPHFLFACYLLYYSFIRPVEMTRLKVSYFRLKDCTLRIPSDDSKNHKTQTVTLPKKVVLYGIEIGVFSAPMDDYVFSHGLKPGPEQIDPKHFRDHWEKVRKALKLKKEWKFYSLKDTGITEMLRNDITPIDVRDQARHSSLSITEIYTDHASKANQDIVEFDGSL